MLGGVVEKKTELAIPPDKTQEAADILKSAGIAATIVESFSVNAAAYREPVDTNHSEEVAARQNLKDCVSREATFRVKYEKKG